MASAGPYASLQLQTDNHTSTPPLCFLQAGCPSYSPTNSVKALKAIRLKMNNNEYSKTPDDMDFAFGAESMLPPNESLRVYAQFTFHTVCVWPTTWKNDIIHTNRKYIVYWLLSEEGQTTATGNKHRKQCNVWTHGFQEKICQWTNMLMAILCTVARGKLRYDTI